MKLLKRTIHGARYVLADDGIVRRADTHDVVGVWIPGDALHVCVTWTSQCDTIEEIDE